jgi:hypothetical protein
VANAARIRLTAIEEGSVRSVLELPEPPGLDGWAPDLQTLSEASLERLIDVVTGEMTAPPDVAAVFVTLSNELDLGTRYESIVFDHTNGDGRRVAVLTPQVRDRLRDQAAAPVVERPDLLRGTLVEADFERSTARLKTPADDAVLVNFPPDLGDAIKDALRVLAEFAGEVVYDPTTNTATSIRLREVHQAQAIWPGLVSGDYREHMSLADLQARGVIRPIESPEQLRAPGSHTGDDLDAFFDAIAE